MRQSGPGVPSRPKERGSANIYTTAGGRDKGLVAADLEKILSGNKEAFRRIMEEFSPLVFSIAVGITESKADAEDVLQEVFIRLPEALKTFRWGDFPAWLKKIAARQALMWMRTEARHRRNATSFMHSDRVEERIMSRIVVDRAVAQLDPAFRTVYVLKEVEGLTHAEIAEVMEISINLSQVRLSRARAAIRAIIEPS